MSVRESLRFFHKFDPSMMSSMSLANDISKGSFGFNKVRTTFAGAHGILTAAAFHRAGLMSSRREGRYVNLRGSDHDDIRPEDMSILSTVMGVTQEVRFFIRIRDRRGKQLLILMLVLDHQSS